MRSISALDLGDATLHVLGLAAAFDDRGLVLADDDLLGLPEVSDSGDGLEGDAEVLEDRLAARQDCDVLEHRLATIAEARRLDGRALEDAAQLVDDERRERFAFDVLGDDQQRAAGSARSSRAAAACP